MSETAFINTPFTNKRVLGNKSFNATTKRAALSDISNAQSAVTINNDTSSVKKRKKTSKTKSIYFYIS